MLTRILVQKHILQMRKGALDGVHTPFRSLPHWCCLSLSLDIQPLLLVCCHGQDNIILQRLDEEGSVHLYESRINCALPAGIVVTAPSLLSYPPPMCNLVVMNRSWNVEKCDRNGPVRANQRPMSMSRSDHASTRYNNEPGSRYFLTAASTAWARPLWTTHQTGVGKLHHQILYMRLCPHLRDWNLGKGITLQHLDDHAAAKAQIHTQIGACHTKNQLQCH